MSTDSLNRTATVLRWIIGLMFIVSGLLKTINPVDFYESALPFAITAPSSMVETLAPLIRFAPLLGPAELVLGVALVVGVGIPAAASAIALLVLGFIVMLLRAVMLQMDVKCGCFGRAFEKSAGASLIFDIVLLIAVLFVLALSLVRAVPRWKYGNPTVIIAAVLSFGILAALYFPQWQSLPLHDLRVGRSLAAIDTKGQFDLMKGDYFVDIMLPTCEHCQEEAPQINALHASGFATVVALSSDAFSKAEEDAFRSKTGAEFPIIAIPAHQHFRLRWVAELPRLALIRDGKVLKVWPHEHGEGRLQQIANEAKELLAR